MWLIMLVRMYISNENAKAKEIQRLVMLKGEVKLNDNKKRDKKMLGACVCRQ